VEEGRASLLLARAGLSLEIIGFNTLEIIGSNTLQRSKAMCLLIAQGFHKIIKLPHLAHGHIVNEPAADPPPCLP
jgi:hypothetical protein